MAKDNLGFNQESIQNLNRTLLLHLLRREGLCARIRLAELSGLKQATVTHIVNDFIDWGIVREVGFLTGNKGRRSIGISINNEEYAVIGIRIARKNYSVGVFNLSGQAIQVKRRDIPGTQTSRTTFDKIISDTKELIDTQKERKIAAIGLAIPGPYSFRHRRIELMTGVSGWNEIAIEDELNEAFRLPVFIEQDANAGAMAQYWYNTQSMIDDDILVYIAAGQGVGAGIISHGSLMKGSIGVAGEIGHTTIDIHGARCSCGNYGCLENYCSSIAFTREVNRRKKSDRELTFAEAALLVKENDEMAREVFLECCEHLSVGVINVINSFNPKYLVIGDEMSHIEPEIMLACITKEAEARILPEIFNHTKIMMSVVEQDSMVHGAAVAAITEIFADPEKYLK